VEWLIEQVSAVVKRALCIPEYETRISAEGEAKLTDDFSVTLEHW